MKVENHSDPLVYWFHHKTHISQKRGFSWWNHTTFSVQNATKIIHFIVTAKIPMGIRSISAEPANINLHPNTQEHGKSIGGSIRLVPCAERPFCITITNTIPTTAAAIRSAIIPFLSGNRPMLLLLPCPRSSASTILSECVILSRPSSRLYPCFISARILFGISV